jgi:DNA polymerase III epsilon subunit
MNRIVLIDTETTGKYSFNGDRVIEIAAVEIVDGVISKDNYFCTYVNPQGKKISLGARRVHGIKDQDLLDAPTFSDIAHDFLEFIKGATLSCYNKKFDFGFIQMELDRAGVGVSLIKDFKSNCLMLDVAQGGRWLKLDDACRKYHIDISLRKVHSALVDTFLSAELYFKFHDRDFTPLEQVPQSKTHSAPTARPIPRAFKHPLTNEMVQLNYCKNPNCENYGVIAKNPGKDKDGKPKRGLGNDYKLTSVKSGKVLTCKLCNTSRTLINNRSFVMESIRVQDEHKLIGASCNNSKIEKGRGKGKPCPNVDKDIIDFPELYARKGIRESTSKGQPNIFSQKYECKRCHKRFNVPCNPQMGQHKTDLNNRLFMALVNKGIINRIQEELNVAPTFIYNRIEFFYSQCIQFDQWHIRNNIHQLSGTMLEISMDRQHYLANWNDKRDRKPTKLVNTSSVDNSSRFVLASTINFDFCSDWEAIKAEARKRKDAEKPVYDRLYSQYIISDIDVESDDVEDALALKAPASNLLVQQTYSLMAHIEQVKPFYEVCSHSDIFADDDEGFELGISLVLKDLINQQKVYPVLIRADRNNASQMQDRRTWSEQVLRDEGFTEKEIKDAQYDTDRLRALNQKYWTATLHQRNENIGSTKSEWLVHPFPKYRQTMEIKPLIQPYGVLTEQSSDALMDISTYGVDNYFQMIRRRINMLERPITSATNGLRWNGYAAYNPKWAAMLVDIFRVYHNYVHTDKKTLRNKKSNANPKTPAQKLGLARKVYSVDEILSFSPLFPEKT